MMHLPHAAWTLLLALLPASLLAQAPVDVKPLPDEQKVAVRIDGKPFTEFLYADSMEKPILYPLRAASGNIVTRGFPLAPRPGERTDHPHHVGLWLTYENVNGLDFWNNSYAIPADKKPGYGWIRTQKILETRSGKKGLLRYAARWEKQDGTVLLDEETRYTFSGDSRRRIIDRVTTLTAKQVVQFKDAKDGMLGLRVARALELPSTEAASFTDDKGNVTVVAADKDHVANGQYLTSEGKTGDDAWSTRGKWCILYGTKDGEKVTIGIVDHPSNPGYPTYWHARGYGLFAANPLGQAIFSKGKQSMNLTLKPGDAVTFRYRIVVLHGQASKEDMDKLAADFAKTR